MLAFDGDLASAREENRLWDHATALLPQRDVDRYTQGLMDLGATVCSARKPDCGACPVNDLCAGQREAERYPIKTRKLKRSRRENWWLWLEHEGRVLLQQRPAPGVGRPLDPAPV